MAPIHRLIHNLMQKTKISSNFYGLVWITGLSGSGKTTVAKSLVSKLRSNSINPIWLDGDNLRKALLIDGEYSRNERLKIAQKYCNLAKIFVDQKHLVICSTISLFYEIQDWNRTNIIPYLEVFLDVPEAIRIKRDSQGYFERIGVNEVTEFAGSHFNVDLPKNPDLHIHNFGDHNVEDTVAIIWQELINSTITSDKINSQNPRL